MSYLFDASSETLRGALAAPIGFPIQVGLWIRRTADVTGGRTAMSIGGDETFASQNNAGCFIINSQASEDRVTGRSKTSGGASNNAILSMADGTWSATAGPNADGWLPVLLSLDGATGSDPLQTMTSREIRIYGGSATESTVRTNGFTKFDAISIGADIDGTQYLGQDATASYIAEIAIWKTLLAAGEITSFESGLIPSSINSSNLVWYGDLRADANKDAGSDTLANLTITGTTNSSGVHPVITSGLDPIRLIWRM